MRALEVRISLFFLTDFSVMENQNLCFYLPSLRNLHLLFIVWRPPALPHRLQCSTIGRSGLNHRVRDGNGCVP